MTRKDWVFASIEAALWYAFIYVFLYTIKNEISIIDASFVLLVLAYAAVVFCPLVRKTDAWKRLFG